MISLLSFEGKIESLIQITRTRRRQPRSLRGAIKATYCMEEACNFVIRPYAILGRQRHFPKFVTCRAVADFDVPVSVDMRRW